MATRSTIIAKIDGMYHRIYCHWDGYLSNNGRILVENYTTHTKVKSLIRLGDLSKLGEKIGRKHAFERPTFGTPAYEEYKKSFDHMCLAYKRDRGETGTQARTYHSFLEACMDSEQYIYYWDGFSWFLITDDKKAIPLNEAVEKDAKND